MNVPKNIVPDDIKDCAISVADAAQEPVSRVQILADVLFYMEELYEAVLRMGLPRFWKNGANIPALWGSRLRL